MAIFMTEAYTRIETNDDGYYCYEGVPIEFCSTEHDRIEDLMETYGIDTPEFIKFWKSYEPKFFDMVAKNTNWRSEWDQEPISGKELMRMGKQHMSIEYCGDFNKEYRVNTNRMFLIYYSPSNDSDSEKFFQYHSLVAVIGFENGKCGKSKNDIQYSIDG